MSVRVEIKSSTKKANCNASKGMAAGISMVLEMPAVRKGKQSDPNKIQDKSNDCKAEFK